MIGYFWSPLLRRERPPGIGEHSIGIVLVPAGGAPLLRVLPGNEDLDWAIDWIRAELAEQGEDPSRVAAWWKVRSAQTEDPVRLGPPAPGVAENPEREIELLVEALVQQNPWAHRPGAVST